MPIEEKTHATRVPNCLPGAMDFKICAALAVLETVSVASLREFHVIAALRTWAGLLLFQYLLVKAYRVLLYPFYVSPLRHLPGPKVGART